ncbi:hypothetical protein D7W82_20210 [Corallococcus sp. CA049B]|nr:hypothetical protein D7W82_20210 [Corallococcus sp. CA049B]
MWLETLDLEPLPRETNLLATVLVRIRSAVEERLGTHDQGHERPLLSLLDEDGQDPWNELDQLIQDAAFIWEDLAKPDRRMQAQQQIKSAEIYTTFRTRFTRVMDAILKAVSQREFGRSDHPDVFLVLPIDNVDRSVDHVSWMLIVTQLVSSRWLWFVLAANRSDLQALLERGYQKELAGGNQGEKQASQGPYDAQSIARRQAASTLRRELPPLQRITIGPVLPWEAWGFSPRAAAAGPEHDSLGALLESIPLPIERNAPEGGKSKDAESSKNDRGMTYLADLFNIEPRMSDSVRKAWEAKPKPDGAAHRKREDSTGLVFTQAAKQALTLPARSLLDLWQSAHRAANKGKDGPKGKDGHVGESAIELVRDVLRNVTNESDLPFWASEIIQYKLIRKNMQDETVLRLDDCRIDFVSMGGPGLYLELPPARTDGAETFRKTSIQVREFYELHLRLVPQSGTATDPVALPPTVAGWFMVLYDLLMISPEPRIVLSGADKPQTANCRLVLTSHQSVEATAPPLEDGKTGIPARELLMPVMFQLKWSIPEWGSICDVAIFAAQWEALRFRLERAFLRQKPLKPKARQDLMSTCAEVLRLAWVDNICSVTSASYGQWDCSRYALDYLERMGGKEDPDAVRDFCCEAPGAAGKALMEKLEDLFLDFNEPDRAKHNSPPLSHLSNDERRLRLSRFDATRRWMEEFLPLFLGPDFVPPEPFSSPLRDGKPPTTLSALGDLWRGSEPLINALRRERLLDALKASKAWSEVAAMNDKKDSDCFAWASRFIGAWTQNLPWEQGLWGPGS